MTQRVHVINYIEAPRHMVETAIQVRGEYVAYFARQPGFVESVFYRERCEDGADPDVLKFVNIVVWDSYASFEAVVNRGFADAEGVNEDGMKVLGRGFPPPIVVHPGRYEILATN